MAVRFKVHMGSGAGNPPAWLLSWPGRILAGLVGAVALVSLFLFFTIFAVVGVVALLVFGVRVWWRMRKMRGAPGRGPRPSGDVIDAEHTVIDVDVIEAPRSEE